MSKLTAKQIEDRVERAIQMYARALARGDIDQKTFDEGLRDLAQWTVAKYARLPQAQTLDAVLGLISGEVKK